MIFINGLKEVIKMARLKSLLRNLLLLEEYEVPYVFYLLKKGIMRRKWVREFI
jgi:hypothetical protein